ncbi:MAG: hypothetical protein HY515_00790 [Candidatus Aenigmarchaeota archaeon]|nr:hypothetical protein [Candidatus Aenigmarchaeota archaeon]
MKRSEMFEINPKALRLYNLYNSGILFVVFDTIDKTIAEGKTEAEITGVASKMLDDLMTDKSIIYVHLWRNEDELYQAVKSQLRATKYCLIFGSGKDNINKIQHVFSALTNDEDLSNFATAHNQRRIGNVDHFSLAIFQKTRIESPEE